MLRPVMLEMAALAPRREIRIAVAARVMLAMTGRQDRYRQPGCRQDRNAGLAAQKPATAGALGARLRIVPGSAVDADDHMPVRTPAGLAAPAGAAEADHRRELRPVDRIEMAVFGADRHGTATLPWPRKGRIPPSSNFLP